MCGAPAGPAHVLGAQVMPIGSGSTGGGGGGSAGAWDWLSVRIVAVNVFPAAMIALR